ncbi:hypothetical protein EZV62_006269 [Acer yangbiense]|uniref:2,4-dienoyl-CoA reductase [(3E)-enoyl-CoA-producing] n=1 Tax=Acer yangbiense TaxID=1000413 RepID=A0A5C7IR91_9ROSI|nr:hypothetical protein EZV62_006269 [Acer yangbiense]
MKVKRWSHHSRFKKDIVRGKVALITGGGSGIGLEISTQFGRHGASIAIMGRRQQVLDSAVSALQSLGIKLLVGDGCWLLGFMGDVRKQEDAKIVVESTFKHFGWLDILVNAAAGNFLVSAADLSPNGFKTGSMSSPLQLWILILSEHSQCATKHLNISKREDSEEAAIDSVTRNLALEWGIDYDIRVNGIAPGPISGTPGMSKLAPDEIVNKACEYMPLYKLGDKWDIAMAALYLACDSGKYVNGTTLIVDGGLWLSQPRHLPKEAVKQLSRAVEKRSRAAPVGVPTSKL